MHARLSALWTASLALALAPVLVACQDAKDGGVDGSTGALEGDPSDADGDGYAEDDCNDGDASVNPGVPELCDSIDNNCDGQVDEGVSNTFYADADGDGYGDGDAPVSACSQPEGTVPGATDCDDGDADRYPAAPELCDGLDNDCDDEVDEGLLVAVYLDADGDGHGDASTERMACGPEDDEVTRGGDCDDGSSLAHPDAEEVCDEVDNDCDGETDEGVTTTFYVDIDGDGWGQLGAVTEACSEPEGYASRSGDCDDAVTGVNPDATEQCNGVDDDCDGTVDGPGASDAQTWYADVDGDGYGDPSSGLAACAAPTGYLGDDQDCDDGDAEVNPDADEICDAVDNDCDGDIDDADADLVDPTTWYLDDDGDGYGDAATSAVSCTAPADHVADATDCDDGDTGIHPGATETCDGVDEDCDSDIDNGVLGTGASCPAEDCTEVLDDNPSAVSGTYVLDFGSYHCDMSTDGGGWTRVGSAASVYGTGYTGTYYNSEGFRWSEMLFYYNSGSVQAHCAYPGSLTGCNNIGFQFASESWGVAQNWGSSLCGLSTTDYTSATTYIGGYDWVISRTESTDTVRVGTLEGIANCTTSDNPGSATMDLLVRR